MRQNKTEYKKWYILIILSLIACSISLLMQIIYGNYLVRIEDWSALMDTSNAVTLVSSVLIIVTVILNIITLVIYKKINAKK
jgi:cytochrome c oxidase subunit 4